MQHKFKERAHLMLLKRLAQLVEHQTSDLKALSSSPTVSKNFFILHFFAFDALLVGGLVPYN